MRKGKMEEVPVCIWKSDDLVYKIVVNSILSVLSLLFCDFPFQIVYLPTDIIQIRDLQRLLPIRILRVVHHLPSVLLFLLLLPTAFLALFLFVV